MRRVTDLFRGSLLESGEIAYQRAVDERQVDGHRKVTLYALGRELGIWVPGTDINEVNETVKAWLQHGDDDQDDDDDFSSRVVDSQGQWKLMTFRRSWIAGYSIIVKQGDDVD